MEAMSTAATPPPQRLSDAERDAAVDALRVHFEDGRLDAAEFDERMSAALRAKTADQVGPLFVDLPEPRPAYAGDRLPLATPASAGPAGIAEPDAPPTAWTRGLATLHAVIWPVAVLLLVTGRFGIAPIFVALIVSIVIGTMFPASKPPRRRKELS